MKGIPKIPKTKVKVFSIYMLIIFPISYIDKKYVLLRKKEKKWEIKTIIDNRQKIYKLYKNKGINI